MTEKAYTFTDKNGTFFMKKPEGSSFLYFPIAGESGLKSCVTPLLGGDSKLDQNTFLLQPVSVEELHNLKGTRNFWCVTGEGEVWSLTGASAESEALRGTELEEESELEAGFMWHRMKRSSVKYGLSSEVTSFVPEDRCPFEMMEVTLRNDRAEEVQVTPIAAVPLYCRSADNIRDHRHVTSLLHRIAVRREGIEVTPTLTFDERGHKKNRLTYFLYGVEGDGRAPVSFCPTVERFIGEGGSLARPLAVYEVNCGRNRGVEAESECGQNSGVEAVPECSRNPGAESASECGRAASPWVSEGAQAAGCEAMGALRFREVVLGPGESHTWCVLFGIVPREEAEENRARLLETFGNREKTEEALDKVRQEWLQKVNVHYETKDPDWDNYMYWVTFQPILRRMYGCSFLPYHDYGRGGRGWRDLWQDCLALLLMEPDGVRQKLVDYYGGVRLDGTNATIIGEKQGDFLADRNHLVRVWMDHGFWPFQTTDMYIQQTGDLEILLEEAPYFKDGQIFRGEKKDVAWCDGQGLKQLDEGGKVVYGSLLEHILLQNVTAFYDVGAHNHIRLRGADWNDGLDMASENGESVTFTAAYAGNLEQIAALLRLLDERVQSGSMKGLELHREVLWLLQDHGDAYDSVSRKQEILQEYYRSCKHLISGEKEKVSPRELAGILEGMAAWIRKHISETEWVTAPEGSFFNGYYDNHGKQLEGFFPGGTRMTLTGQVFPIMFGTASEEQVKEIVRAADRLLYRPEIGGYRLNTDFHEVKEDMGRAFGFAYGHKENGAVFSHMSVMYANALYRRGFIQEGFRVLDALYRQSMDFETSRIYPGLPEYFSDTGRGMYPYLTGSASWLMMTVVTLMYGVAGRMGDLVLEPALLREQLDEEGRIALTLRFADVPLHIRYEAGEEREIYRGAKEVYLDGRKMEGNRISKEELCLCRSEGGADAVHEILVKL